MTDRYDGLTRRQFGRWLAGTAAVLAGCGTSERYSPRDRAALDRQRAAEEAGAGTGPYGPLRFRGYRGLADLPYFDLDEDGQLRLLVDDLPPGIDFHAHLGFNLLFAPDFDLLRRTPRIQYLLDCDRDGSDCDLDLDRYINSAFSEHLHDELEGEFVAQLLWGSEAAATHTIPNLVAEMDRVKFGQVAILPIAAGLPFGDDLTERWMDAIARSGQTDRLIPFASVHPGSGRSLELLRKYAKAGARGVKLHPEMQRFFPDDDGAMEIYEECGKLGLPIIFHCGRSGIEPEGLRPYPLPRWFAGPALTFPKTQFVLGHAGARDVDGAIELSKRFDNVWLEITGQGVTQLDRILNETDTGRVVFGSDWPFYPLAATLAKVLLVTEKRRELRAAILRSNAERCFAIARG